MKLRTLTLDLRLIAKITTKQAQNRIESDFVLTSRGLK